MTHTLHRICAPADSNRDFVMLAMASKGINDREAIPKLSRFLQIALKHDPVNYGDMQTGNAMTAGKKEILDNLRDASIVHAVFNSADNVFSVLKDLKAADLGLSVVVTGNLRTIKERAEKEGLTPHTLNCSLGIWGRLDRLPERATLEILTMCGHGLISGNLIRDTVSKIRSGDYTPQSAANRLAGLCACGIFNPDRAARLLEAMARTTED